LGSKSIRKGMLSVLIARRLKEKSEPSGELKKKSSGLSEKNKKTPAAPLIVNTPPNALEKEHPDRDLPEEGGVTLIQIPQTQSLIRKEGGEVGVVLEKGVDALLIQKARKKTGEEAPKKGRIVGMMSPVLHHPQRRPVCLPLMGEEEVPAPRVQRVPRGIAHLLAPTEVGVQPQEIL